MGRKLAKINNNFDAEFRFLLDADPAFEDWRALAAEWFAAQKNQRVKRIGMVRFFVRYLYELELDKRPVALLDTHSNWPSLEDALDMVNIGADSKRYYLVVLDFLDWVLKKSFSEIDAEGRHVIPAHLRNPLRQPASKRAVRKFDPEFRFLLDLDPAFEDWRALAAEWLLAQNDQRVKRVAMGRFFVRYLYELELDKRPLALLDAHSNWPSMVDVLDLENFGAESRRYYLVILKFLDWVLKKKFSEIDAEGRHAIPAHLRNPLPQLANKQAVRRFDPQFRFLIDIDPAFEDWRVLATEWLSTQKNTLYKQCDITWFFVRYVHDLNLGKRPVTLLAAHSTHPTLQDAMNPETTTERKAKRQYETVSDFLNWVLKNKFAEYDGNGHRVVPAHLRNPFPSIRSVGRFDLEFRALLDIDPAFEDWRALAAEWFPTQKNLPTRRALMTHFFMHYLHKLKLDKRPIALLDAHSTWPSLRDALELKGLGKKQSERGHNTISDFLDWVLRTKFSEIDAEGHRVIPAHLRNPFPRTHPKATGKQSDLEFRYVLDHDTRMEDWRALANEWMAARRRSLDAVRSALDKFLLTYIFHGEQERNPYAFLRRATRKTPFLDVLLAAKKVSRETLPGSGPTRDDAKCNNFIHDFLAWVLSDKLSVEDDTGERVIPIEFHNPVPKYTRDRGHSVVPSETLKMPLPYRYIKELRAILAPGPTFRSWEWAHLAKDTDRGGDWFVADPGLVNPDDPDCVWRERVTTDYERETQGRPEKVVELWSPVRSAAVYLKLELPLRTYQVRMLDSGEADTWRYESGKFVLNDWPLKIGDEKRPSQRGVFHRSSDHAGAGFYINSNKTSDINKEDKNKGYVIPWTYEPVLYWLERLRNWQTRYNPIDAPTPWVDLQHKHFGRMPPHRDELEERGSACFLFRDAAAKGEDWRKPVSDSSVSYYWYRLLCELEKRCARRGETLDDGSPIRFVNPDSYVQTYYPLHALRVSLITAYALEGGVPFAVISKLIAGHARIIMTVYYTKAGKAFVTEIMQEAECRMQANEAAGYKRFLMEGTYQELEQRFAHVSPDAVNACLQQKSAAGFMIEDKGICPVGAGLCDIGGEPSGDQNNLFGPVSGYPQERNCIRCRFFLSGPAFLPGLIARFNQISYEATECSERYVRLEKEVHALEEARSACEERDEVFALTKDLERASQRYEAEAEKANKLIGDLHACLRLINRSIEIADSQAKDSSGMGLVANGGISDIQFALIETESEMHQLEVMCENAVIYPEVDASKANLRRSQILDAMLEMNGKPPVFFRLSPDQQLKVGNEVMKLIQARTGSLKSAVEIAECHRMLSEFGLLEETVNLIEGKSAGVDFRQVIEAVRNSKRLPDANRP